MKPSDKVVCVNDRFTLPDALVLYSELPIKGRVYCLREVLWNIEETILLVSVVGISGVSVEHREARFQASRFRLLDEMKAEAGRLQAANRELDSNVHANAEYVRQRPLAQKRFATERRTEIALFGDVKEGGEETGSADFGK